MGIDTESRAEEEDFTFEETITNAGRKGNEGCDSVKYMLCLRAYQESAFIMPILCEGLVLKTSSRSNN